MESKTSTTSFRSSIVLLAIAVAFANFVDLFLYAIIIPIIPFVLEERLGLQSDAAIQHSVSILLAVYGAAWFLFSPLSALLADSVAHLRYGRRCCILGSILILTGATVLLCLGKSMPMLIAGRTLQGASSAMTLTVPQAWLAQRAGQAKVGRYLGFVTLANAVANMIAPCVAGVMFARVGDESVYFLAFALIGVQFMLWLLVDENHESGVISGTRVDLEEGVEEAQAWTMSMPPSVPVPATIYLIKDDGYDFKDVSIISISETSTIDETPTKPSRLPIFLQLLLNLRMFVVLLAVFIIYSIIIGFDAILPFHIYHIFGWNSTQGGLVMMALYLPNLFGPLVGWLSDRYSARWLVTGGFLVMMPLLILLRFIDHKAKLEMVAFVALVVAIGAAAALVQTPLSAEIARVVDKMTMERGGRFGGKDATASAYGLMSMACAAAAMVGPLWAGLLTAYAGFGITTVTLGIAAAVMALGCCFGLASKSKRNESIQTNHA